MGARSRLFKLWWLALHATSQALVFMGLALRHGHDISQKCRLFLASSCRMMGALFDVLAPKLEERFPGRGMRREEKPSPKVIFPAVHADVGDLVIYDCESEFAVVYGVFTHEDYVFAHYPPVSATDRTDLNDAVEDLLDDLEVLFNDRIVMWGKNERLGDYRGGLCRLRDDATWLPGGRTYFVWSGPFRDDNG